MQHWQQFLRRAHVRQIYHALSQWICHQAAREASKQASKQGGEN